MYYIGRLVGDVPELLLEKAAPPLVKAEPKPYTLPHLIGWLETKDPAQSYYWECHSVCMLGQYQAEVGIPSAQGWSPYTHVISNMGALFVGRSLVMNSKLSHAAYIIAQSKPRTFGAALERAKAVEAAWASA